MYVGHGPVLRKHDAIGSVRPGYSKCNAERSAVVWLFGGHAAWVGYQLRLSGRTQVELDVLTQRRSRTDNQPVATSQCLPGVRRRRPSGSGHLPGRTERVGSSNLHRPATRGDRESLEPGVRVRSRCERGSCLLCCRQLCWWRGWNSGGYDSSGRQSLLFKRRPACEGILQRRDGLGYKFLDRADSTHIVLNDPTKQIDGVGLLLSLSFESVGGYRPTT